MSEHCYRIAMIGCGRMGRLHTARLQKDGRARVVALFDVDAGAAGSLQQDLASDAAVFSDVDTLLQTGDLNAAIICTPTPAHFEQVRACRERGLAVLCEKPLADNAARTQQLIAESQSGSPLVVGYQRRSWATYRTLQREVASGRWGPIGAVTSHNTEYWQQTIAGTWRDDPQINPGGYLGDAGSHKLDTLLFVSGLTPASVFARSDNCGSRVPIVTTASAMTHEGVPIALDFIGNAHHQAEDLQIHCESADLMVRDWRVWIARGNVVQPLGPLEPDSQPALAFLDVLDGTLENPAPAECALPVLLLTEAILESSRIGLPVPVSGGAD